jgi:hypothetical protein
MRHATGLLLIMSALLTAGCAADQQSPLERAAVLGQRDEVARLLAGGADPRERTNRGFTALGLAAREGRVEVIELLVRAGADPNLRDTNENEWTPLLNAVHKHQRPAVVTLLRLGADPDIGGGLTPLIMAAGYGDTDMVRLLLDRGADPYRAVKPGENALGAAVGGSVDIDEWKLGDCQAETVKLLLERAPDLRLPGTVFGWFDIWKARMGNCAEVLRLVEGRRGAPRAASAGSR